MSKTSLVARQCRLREWAAMIRECNQRPDGMSIDEWCNSHSITKANYYYWMKQVRKACLDAIPEAMLAVDLPPFGGYVPFVHAVYAVLARQLHSVSLVCARTPTADGTVGTFNY